MKTFVVIAMAMILAYMLILLGGMVFYEQDNILTILSLNVCIQFLGITVSSIKSGESRKKIHSRLLKSEKPE